MNSNNRPLSQNGRSRVAVVRCEDYHPDHVSAAVSRGFELLGGTGRFFQKSEKILLKPNLLAGDVPERCVTTHPSVFMAVGRRLLEAGLKLEWGDSPGFGSMTAAARKAGILEAAQALRIPPADMDTAVPVSFPEALLAKQLELAKGALETDGIVSLSKMKTHGLTRITGAVKNLFGCVPGLRKGEFHVKMPGIDHFAAMLVDINRRLRPRFHIMDGIIAMEGNGPRGGIPRPMKVILFSDDPVALDAVFCRLIDLPCEFVPTMLPGEESGLGTCDWTRIEWLGDPFDTLHAPDFDAVRTSSRSAAGKFPVFLKNRLAPRPVIDPALCLLCGNCVEVCPVRPKAVHWFRGDRKSPPVFNYKQCIRCYCCQELCPHRAISLSTPFLARLIRRR